MIWNRPRRWCGGWSVSTEWANRSGWCIAQRPSMILAPNDGSSQIDCSPQTARDIDNEVKRLLDSAYADAKDILTRQRDKLDLVAQELIKRETLDGPSFRQLLDVSPVPADGK